MLATVRGRVWKLGNDVNTDVIFPGKYTYTVTDPREIASHALEDADPTFASRVQEGDIVVAGRNFGCGSSREQAASALKYAGVGAVVAASFARIYFRNAINLGLPVIVCPEAAAAAEAGDEMTIRLADGLCEVRGATYTFPPLPDFLLAILADGGLIPHLKKTLAAC
jgi:3-isopropylmalate/(R)-2-methylmalate dehydratase small subunit